MELNDYGVLSPLALNMSASRTHNTSVYIEFSLKFKRRAGSHNVLLNNSIENRGIPYLQ